MDIKPEDIFDLNILVDKLEERKPFSMTNVDDVETPEEDEDKSNEL